MQQYSGMSAGRIWRSFRGVLSKAPGEPLTFHQKDRRIPWVLLRLRISLKPYARVTKNKNKNTTFAFGKKTITSVFRSATVREIGVQTINSNILFTSKPNKKYNSFRNPAEHRPSPFFSGVQCTSHEHVQTASNFNRVVS